MREERNELFFQLPPQPHTCTTIRFLCASEAARSCETFYFFFRQKDRAQKLFQLLFSWLLFFCRALTWLPISNGGIQFLSLQTEFPTPRSCFFTCILRKKLHTTFLLLKKHATTTPTHFMQKTSLGKENRKKLPQGRKIGENFPREGKQIFLTQGSFLSQ